MSLTCKENIGQDSDLEMAAAAVVDELDLVGLTSTGYARRLTLGDKFAGLAVDAKDNTDGAAGAKMIRTRRGLHRIKVALTGVALTDAVNQSPVYATDHETLSLREGVRVGYVESFVKDDGQAIVVLDPDAEIEIYSETVSIGEFTDNTDATGYVDLAVDIPEGAVVLAVQLDVKTGFTGDTTAVADVGIAGALEKFASDLNVLAADVEGEGNAPVYVDADNTVRVTVTGTLDFTSISAGEMDVRVIYSRRSLV